MLEYNVAVPHQRVAVGWHYAMLVCISGGNQPHPVSIGGYEASLTRIHYLVTDSH